jgi:hypothetical protein
MNWKSDAVVMRYVSQSTSQKLGMAARLGVTMSSNGEQGKRLAFPIVPML